MLRKIASAAALLAALLVFSVLSQAAQLQPPQAAPQQQQWKWPENPTNIKVLPKEIVGVRLRPVMVGFTSALGVRCTYCHKGVEGAPLTTYDFASDENPNKDRAREMLRMLKHINDDLKNIQPSGDQRVNMWCNTCHHGRPRPMTLPEELGEQYRKSGVEAALEHYADLKQRFYGRGAYDFGEDSLNAFGYAVLEKGDAAGSVEVFKLNALEFPQSANVWDSLGEACLRAGDTKNAAQFYEKSLTRDPNNQNAKEMLEEIKKSQAK